MCNAGRGSTLGAAGTVQCDACLCSEPSGVRTAVCGVMHVRNPARLCLAMAVNFRAERPPYERPLVLQGDGADAFARACDLPMCLNSELVCKRAQRQWLRWTERLERAARVTAAATSAPVQSESSPAKRTCVDSGAVQLGASDARTAADDGDDRDDTDDDGDDDDDGDGGDDDEADDGDGTNDTVGVVGLAASGAVCCVSSSGGTLLKHDGRVGHAGVPAGACAAASLDAGGACGAVASGCGEGLMLFDYCARVRSECVATGDTHSASEAVLRAYRERVRAAQWRLPEEAGHVVLLRAPAGGGSADGDAVEACFAHSTRAMAFGVLSVSPSGASSGSADRPSVSVTRCAAGRRDDGQLPSMSITVVRVRP